jgi:hypothetical protein
MVQKMKYLGVRTEADFELYEVGRLRAQEHRNHQVLKIVYRDPINL